MQETLMDQAVELMLYGMGTVFIFLALLVVVTVTMSAIIGRYFKPEPVLVPTRPTPTGKPTPVVDDGELIAVITTAVHKYRQQNTSSKK